MRYVTSIPMSSHSRKQQSDVMLSYLDIEIKIDCGKYITALYDKRDSFNFFIVNFPYMSSNIPTKPTYGVYISQLIRISRICDDYSVFTLRHRTLTTRLIRQGFWYSKLCMAFKRFSRRHVSLFSKFNVSLRKHIQQGICLPLGAKHDLAKHVTLRRRQIHIYIIYNAMLIHK